MRSWKPVPGTTTGGLVVAALELFGSRGFARVSVASIAERAGVTTGALYHYVGSKARPYLVVRADVEQRVLDPLEGAAAGRSVRSLAELAPVLLVGFDYLVGSGYARMLGEPSPAASDGAAQPDEIERLLGRLLGADGAPIEALISAAWRAALRHASDGPVAARDARAGLARLLAGA